MKIVKSLCYALALNGLAANESIANAAQDTFVLSFSLAKELLNKNNIELKRGNVEVSISEAELKQDRLFENPEISIQHNINNPVTGRYFEFGYDGQTDIQLSQRIYIGGQRAEKVRMKKANVQRTKAELKNTERLLLRDIFSMITESFYIQQKITILNEEVDMIDRILQLYETQLQKGNVSNVEVIRIKSQKIQLQKEINELELADLSTQNQLRLILGIEQETDISVDVNENEIFSKIESLTTDKIMADIENRSDLQIARQNIEMAKYNVKLQRANVLPELKIEGEWDKNGNIGHNYFGAGVSLTLPIFNHNQGNVNAAHHNLENRQLEFAFLQREVENEKLLNWQCLQRLQKEADESGKVAEEMSTQIINNAQLQYMNHNISLLELIDHLETYKDVQFSHINNKTELIKKTVSLDLLNK